ncbi:subtilisin-like protein [Trichoderma barbatum]
MLEQPSCSHSKDGGTELKSQFDLLLATSQTFCQMAEVARRCVIDEEKRIFFSHLGLHCMRIRESIADACLTSPRFNNDLISNALLRLRSLIAYSSLQEPPSSMAWKTSLEDFNLQWSNTQAQASPTAVSIFVRGRLKLGAPKEHLTLVNRTLEYCADKIEKARPEKSFKRSTNGSLSTDGYEPSFGVSNAAQDVFNALLMCKGCSCSEKHEFGAKLELGTYRTPVNTEKKNPTIGFSQKLMSRDSAATGELDFDMFLSKEHDWHEVRVQTVKERVVGFAANDRSVRSREARRIKRVEELCKSIGSTKSGTWSRLVLKLTSGQLFNVRLEKSNFWIDKSTEPISLLRCFEERHESFTEKTKRILSLIIGYAALHLDGTSWLQLGWGSANIKFFQTTSHKTPLRPFIQIHLPEAGATTDIEIDSRDQDDTSFNDLDDLDSGHRCPTLIALAIVLIEVYFAKTFTKLAQMSGIPLENPDGRITLLDVDQVFNGEEENKVEGWRSQIPEDSPLLIAIDNCLDPELWEDEEGNALDNAKIKFRIFKDIIRPLELHLSSGFSKIPLDNVDSYARGLDFGQWGQVIDGHEPQNLALGLSQSLLPPTRTVSSSTLLSNLSRVGPQRILPELERPIYQHSQAASLTSSTPFSTNLDITSNSEASYRELQFFEDETDDGDTSKSADFRFRNIAYLHWRSQYDKVYTNFITTPLSLLSPKAVKIAILDTGIDRGHDAFEAREEYIKGRFNCCDESQKNNIRDLNGHGTFTASLILDYAPDAELYIMKIAHSNDRPNAVIALNHAIDIWDVDIISLSFGWPSTRFEGYSDLQGAIDKAYSKKVLIFAAASNNGGRLGRAYPASSTHVICVHSTDTLGNPSAFSPTAQPYNLNFATVGESIKSAWPMALCDEKSASQGYFNSRSGTSYATPIMAGIAAFLLMYARLHLSEEDAVKLKSKATMEALFKRCAERGPNYAPRGNYHYVELSLYDHNLFGKEMDRINSEILDILDT